MYNPEEISARIKASQEIGSLDFITRGGFSETQAFYLSFADPDLPKGTQWLGGCYIRAESIDEALLLSKILDINPGGEVQVMGPFNGAALLPEYEHRLLHTQQDVNLAVDESKIADSTTSLNI